MIIFIIDHLLTLFFNSSTKCLVYKIDDVLYDQRSKTKDFQFAMM